MFDTGQRLVSWTYPSRYNCMLCHNKLGGSSLGPETRQLNRSMNGENLLEKLERSNLFDAPLPKPYLPTPYDSSEGKPPEGASNAELARSYLHANCAFCHRADGNSGTLDLRHDVSLPSSNACNTPPMKGGAGLSTYTILTPGKPMESVLWARMQTLDDKNRMPQIATYVVDQPGVKLVSDWIASIPSCQ
jgi:mono/diheme cytochrome c family protein